METRYPNLRYYSLATAILTIGSTLIDLPTPLRDLLTIIVFAALLILAYRFFVSDLKIYSALYLIVATIYNPFVYSLMNNENFIFIGGLASICIFIIAMSLNTLQRNLPNLPLEIE